jgi:hypothetical protein
VRGLDNWQLHAPPQCTRRRPPQPLPPPCHHSAIAAAMPPQNRVLLQRAPAVAQALPLLLQPAAAVLKRPWEAHPSPARAKTHSGAGRRQGVSSRRTQAPAWSWGASRTCDRSCLPLGNSTPNRHVSCVPLISMAGRAAVAPLFRRAAATEITAAPSGGCCGCCCRPAGRCCCRLTCCLAGPPSATSTRRHRPTRARTHPPHLPNTAPRRGAALSRRSRAPCRRRPCGAPRRGP